MDDSYLVAIARRFDFLEFFLNLFFFINFLSLRIIT